ncbi:MAG: Alcohol dehydrogenase GroES domain protein [Frondihabitans sp.]|nr:Alcohol dehydrogenase GroES domain protein [Frondihabitans sp.]
MKAAALTSPGHIELVEKDRPHAHNDLVVVKILVAPMCTENKDRRGGIVTDTLGHEAAGVVVDAGTSRRLAVGDRVVVMPGSACGLCRYCVAGEHIYCPFPRDVLAESNQSYGTATFTEYVLKADWLLVPVPDDVSLRHAAAACCLLGPSFNASNRMSLTAADTYLVAGCGPVGLGAVGHGLARGARVLALETHPYRMALAARLGAEVFDPLDAGCEDAILEATGGWGVSASTETSGVASNPALLARVSERRARLSVVAWGLDISLPPIVPLGLDIYGCWHWNHQRFGVQMMETIRRLGKYLDEVVTHTFPLEEVSAAMDLQDSGNCGKIFLLPHGEVEA